MALTLTEAAGRDAVESAPRAVLHELPLRRLRTTLARRGTTVHPVGALPRGAGKAVRVVRAPVTA